VTADVVLRETPRDSLLPDRDACSPRSASSKPMSPASESVAAELRRPTDGRREGGV